MIKTPCISVCKMERGICKGCKRTLEEISKWRSYTDQEREKIMRDLQNR